MLKLGYGLTAADNLSVNRLQYKDVDMLMQISTSFRLANKSAIVRRVQHGSITKSFLLCTFRLKGPDNQTHYA